MIRIYIYIGYVYIDMYIIIVIYRISVCIQQCYVYVYIHIVVSRFNCINSGNTMLSLYQTTTHPQPQETGAPFQGPMAAVTTEGLLLLNIRQREFRH